MAWGAWYISCSSVRRCSSDHSVNGLWLFAPSSATIVVEEKFSTPCLHKTRKNRLQAEWILALFHQLTGTDAQEIIESTTFFLASEKKGLAAHSWATYSLARLSGKQNPASKNIMSDKGSSTHSSDFSDGSPSTTTISTVAVQAGQSKIILAVLRVSWCRNLLGNANFSGF